MAYRRKMGLRLSLLLIAALTACGRNESKDSGQQASTAISGEQVVTLPTRPLGNIPIVAYIDPIDKQIASTGLPVAGRYSPCTREQIDHGEAVIVSIPTDQCVIMDEPELWRGRWLNDLEGSRFCPSSQDGDECNLAGTQIWLEPGPMKGELGEVYSVSFIGRKTKYPGGYGHLGLFEAEIIVDRVIAKEIVASQDH